mmetsp:Transcript_20043/g.55734  ORF Transcript_20043/g.55734 Transcript_20043/m.55734 type:complete len:225 (+) Transcript_20043:371-1045(+)
MVPLDSSPLISMRLSVVTTVDSKYRSTGRAPKLGVYDASRMALTPLLSSSILIPFGARRRLIPFMDFWRTFSSCSMPRELNMTMAERRLRNSGANECRTFSITLLCAASIWCSGEFSVSPSKNSAPMLLVRMITVLVKSTVRPLESVSLPSSSTCKRIVSTFGCAFSTSSRRTTVYGFFRTASVSCPPSSCPMYPGGAPMSLATECCSWYSLMSMRTRWRSSPS